MTSSNLLRGFDWEGAGRETGERLGAYHALVVIGADPVSTGRVAIGIARAQAGHRRVAVGDLFAESWPIQELVETDDPHGLVDSFLYGVSLSRIAYEVKGAGQLFVMPSGTEPPDYDEIFRILAGIGSQPASAKSTRSWSWPRPRGLRTSRTSSRPPTAPFSSAKSFPPRYRRRAWLARCASQ